MVIFWNIKPTDARFHFFSCAPAWLSVARKNFRAQDMMHIQSLESEKHALCFSVLQRESARHTNCSSPRYILFIVTLLSCTSIQTIICNPVRA